MRKQMKSKLRSPRGAGAWRWASLIAACGAVSTLSAADAAAPAAQAEPAAAAEPAKAEDKAKAEEPAKAEEKEEAPEPATPEEMFEGGKTAFSNWIEFSTGGFFRGGNNAQFQQRHSAPDGAYGGIEDFHYEKEIAKGTLLTTDGRALFDLHDYKLRLGVVKEDLGYLRFSYNEFRTWYNGDGGFYPPSDMFYRLSDDALPLDRGSISFEGGLTLENKPNVTFRYERRYREGTKSSTIWGITHPDVDVTRGLSPSFYEIDEYSDSFQLDVAHTVKGTDLGLGLRYETWEMDNSLKITQSPGEPLQRKITDRQETDYDLFNIHAYSETWLKKNTIMFSSGFSFTDLENDFSGSRIYGSDFDVNYVPNGLNGAGYLALDGGSRMHEYVMNLNLLTIPAKNFTITPSLRVQKEDVDADFGALQTLGNNVATPFGGNSDRDILDVRERLDLRYSGVTNWVFYARGEWTQGDGNLKEIGGTGPVGGVGIAPIQRETEDERFFQKYSAGARWYPLRQVTVDAGGYYKIHEYDYDHELDSTSNTGVNRYPAYLVMHQFETYDAHAGLTLRPWPSLTLGSRYEFQISTVDTRPDPISGLSELETSEMISQIFSQNVTWSPWSRLYLQAGVSYVLSETETPASDVTEAILESQNNYWTLNFNSGLVLNDKTDLKLAYFYYLADNYRDNSLAGVAYGAGDEQHGASATLVRRINENLRLKLKYAYYNYSEELSGGNRDYDAHGIFSSLQYRF